MGSQEACGISGLESDGIPYTHTYTHIYIFIYIYINVHMQRAVLVLIALIPGAAFSF